LSEVLIVGTTLLATLSTKVDTRTSRSPYTSTMSSREALHFALSHRQPIDPYISPNKPPHLSKPFVTLTFATSLDSQLSLAPGVQTVLSGPDSKAMTHYLRCKHDAILIGVGTAIADDPSLNCRIEGVGGYGGEGLDGQPRPVVVDPSCRWDFTAESQVIRLAREGKGKAPWIVTQTDMGQEKKEILESVGGRALNVTSMQALAPNPSLGWADVLQMLAGEGIESVMIEGGGRVINDLLSSGNSALVDSVVVTIAPVWLGKGGIQVCPERAESRERFPVGKLEDVKWIPLGDDVVLCGRPRLGS